MVNRFSTNANRYFSGGRLVFVLVAAFASFQYAKASAHTLAMELGLGHCARILEKTPKENTPKIATLDDLLRAFSQGYVPDLKNPNQRHAFEIYRRMRFGDS